VNGETVFGEADTGSERGTKIEDRISQYEAVGNQVLWVVMTEDRRRSLRAKDRNENSLYGVYEEVVKNPSGKIWLKSKNQLVTLGNKGANPGNGGVTDMATRVEPVMNGHVSNGKAPPDLYPKTYPLPVTQPQANQLVVPAQPMLSEQMQQQMLQLQAEFTRAQMAIGAMPMLMSAPNFLVSNVTAQMDELTNCVEGYETIDLEIAE
jgi:hypothetical protein